MSLLFQSIFGLIALIFIAFLLSENRKMINWKTVASALLLQLGIAFILIKVPGVKNIFLSFGKIVQVLQDATQAGTSFVFGYIGGGPYPFDLVQPGNSYILAFRGLPLILIASALSALLFYWKIIPLIVKSFAWILQKTLGVGGAEGLSAAANVFLGMVESPLFVKPYLPVLSRGELFSLMTCGMATIAGTVMVLYAGILHDVLPDALGHLLIASIISAPASIALARIMVPIIDGQTTEAQMAVPSPANSAMEAITNGTLEGVHLLINVIAMLIVLVSLVSLVNFALELLPFMGNKPITLQRILGWLMSPIVWLIGIPWQEASIAGSLMGTKTILNEFLAYLQMGNLPPGSLSFRSQMIMTYAMCGFANFGSLGIMIGGLGLMAPQRRREIVSLGMKSIISGTLATLMTGAIVGCLMV